MITDLASCWMLAVAWRMRDTEDCPVGHTFGYVEVRRMNDTVFTDRWDKQLHDPKFNRTRENHLLTLSTTPTQGTRTQANLSCDDVLTVRMPYWWKAVAIACTKRKNEEPEEIRK